MKNAISITLLLDFLLLRWRMALPMYTFLPSLEFKIVHPTFVIITYSNKSGCSRSVPSHCPKISTRVAICSHVRNCSTHVDNRCHIWRFCARKWWMVDLEIFVMCSASRTVRCESSLIITLIVFTLTWVVWLTSHSFDFCKVKLCLPSWCALCHW